MANSQSNGPGVYRLSTSGWPTERWAAVVVLGALGILILLRMGFRGVNVMGAGVNLG